MKGWLIRAQTTRSRRISCKGRVATHGRDGGHGRRVGGASWGLVKGGVGAFTEGISEVWIVA